MTPPHPPTPPPHPTPALPLQAFLSKDRTDDSLALFDSRVSRDGSGSDGSGSDGGGAGSGGKP